MRIQLQGVTLRRHARSVLDRVRLEIPSGQSLLILGSSGAGLSLLAKTAAGLLLPDEGEVLYDRRSLATLSPEELRRLQTRTGFVFQDAAIWANLSVRANLELPLRAKHPDLAPREIRERVEQAVAAFRFDVDLDARPSTLSLGRRKAVSFLRAWIPEPEVLFLDEPLAALDHHWKERVLAAVDGWKTRGGTLVVATHDPHPWLDRVDRLALLRHGRLLATGTAAELVAQGTPEIHEILHGRLRETDDP